MQRRKIIEALMAGNKIQLLLADPALIVSSYCCFDSIFLVSATFSSFSLTLQRLLLMSLVLYALPVTAMQKAQEVMSCQHQVIDTALSQPLAVMMRGELSGKRTDLHGDLPQPDPAVPVEFLFVQLSTETGTVLPDYQYVLDSAVPLIPPAQAPPFA